MPDPDTQDRAAQPPTRPDTLETPDPLSTPCRWCPPSSRVAASRRSIVCSAPRQALYVDVRGEVNLSLLRQRIDMRPGPVLSARGNLGDVRGRGQSSLVESDWICTWTALICAVDRVGFFAMNSSRPASSLRTFQLPRRSRTAGREPLVIVNVGPSACSGFCRGGTPPAFPGFAIFEAAFRAVRVQLQTRKPAVAALREKRVPLSRWAASSLAVCPSRSIPPACRFLQPS